MQNMWRSGPILHLYPLKVEIEEPQLWYKETRRGDSVFIIILTIQSLTTLPKMFSLVIAVFFAVSVFLSHVQAAPSLVARGTEG